MIAGVGMQICNDLMLHFYPLCLFPGVFSSLHNKGLCLSAGGESIDIPIYYKCIVYYVVVEDDERGCGGLLLPSFCTSGERRG
jgi:hypothetical protein